MKTASCTTVRELLVEYSDNELDAATSSLIGEHLKSCAACRSELDYLSRSLQCAQQIWRESTEDAAKNEVRSLRSRQSFRARCAVVVALAAVLAGIWMLGTSPWANSRPLPTEMVQTPSATEPSLEMTDITALIADEVQSARLGVSSQLLAGQSSLTDYSRSADSYLATVYKNSAAGAEARRRLDLPATDLPTSSDTGAIP